MNQSIEALAEEAAYKLLQKNNPALLQIIRTFLDHGFTPEQILDICVKNTKKPRHRLAFIGCVADYLSHQARMISELEQ